MNRFAYLTSGFAIKTLSAFTKADIHIHGKENIPEGAKIFTVNHFTRIETLLLPRYIYELTNSTPVWSLADFTLFKGTLAAYFDQVGVISTRDPDRDLLIVKSLLGGEASWIIFPEGRMVKNKKIMDRGRFIISHDGGKHPPHTGAATLGLRTEFYRRRILKMSERNPEEAERLLNLFKLETTDRIQGGTTYIVPVNITYYPLRAQENILSKLALTWVDGVTDRTLEELMTEGSMVIAGVDVDIRFGKPIEIAPYLDRFAIRRDVASKRTIHFDDPIPSKRLMRRIGRRIMERYMGAIYEMTTVNHDHLFASILKKRPFSRIDPEDLRRRVFLAATLDLEGLHVHCHHSLTTDQVHLLTDDRYKKERDFMAVALNTGIVSEANGRLIRDRKAFTAGINFHQIRVDDPVAVIANEVEPLSALQRRLRRISLLPSFWVRRKVVQHLLDRNLYEYEADSEAHRLEDETRPKEIGAPFLIRANSREVGIVLIHGYMAAPYEMAELAVYLGSRGYMIYVPRLKGHGTSPEDLAGRTRADWVASVDAGYAVVRNSCRRVIVGGFSTGAALALDLAHRVRDVQGVFAVSPPRRLQDLSSKKNFAVEIWQRLLDRVRGNHSDFIENSSETPSISYSRNPVSGIREIELFMNELDTKLPNISIPSLVVHTHRDPIADPEGSRRIFEKIGSEDKQYILFNHERHNLLSGEGAHRIHRIIGDFIEDIQY